MQSINRSDHSEFLDKLSKEFSSQEEMDKYLKDHPKANPQKHKIVEKRKNKSDSTKERTLKTRI